MKVLLTGSFGFLREAVLRRLNEGGDGIEPVRPEPWQGPGPPAAPADLSLIRRGVDAVIHVVDAAWIQPSRSASGHPPAEPRQVAAAAAEAGVETFVLASSSLVYPGRSELITARTPADPALDLGREMLETERSVIRLGARTGMAVAVVRLPHVYGPGSILFQYIERGWIPLAGGTEAVFSHLHVGDAAAALVAAAKAGTEDTYLVADGHPVSWDELLDVVRRHRPGLRLLRLSSESEERAMRLLGSRLAAPSMIMPGTGLGWRLEQRIDPGESWRRLGVEPAYPSILSGIPAALRESAMAPSTDGRESRITDSSVPPAAGA